MNERLKRAELKKDIFIGYLNLFFDWIIIHKDKMVILLIAIIAILIAFVSLGSQKKKMDIEASKKIIFAIEKYEKKDFDKAEAEFKNIVDKYLYTYAGYQAVFYLTDYYYNKAEYDKCLDFINKILKKIKDKDELYPKLLIIRAYCFEQKKEYNYAIKGFDDFTKKYKDHYLTPDAYTSLARCYNLSGNIDAARTIGKIVTQKYADSIWAKKAQYFVDL